MIENNLQPTYRRQRFLLSFIRQIKDGVTSTDLQKLVFLYEMKNKEYYNFIPYKFGSYSFQLAEDIDILRRDGYLSMENLRIQAMGDYPHESLLSIATERGDKLIRKTYREYPYYAINSEITNRLFNKKEAEKFHYEKQNYTKTDELLFTIGYEGKSIESFMNALIQNGVRLICDVRKNPLSRKFGFSKNKLKHISETIGIQYIHVPDLGIDSDKRSSLETTEDYQCLFKEYKRTLPTHKAILEQVYSLLRSNGRITLMCYEQDPEMCHRHVIRDYLSNIYGVRSEDL